MAKLLDPVCGMTVDDTALRADGYDDVAFCAPGCRKRFLDDPDAYPDRLDAAAPAANAGGGCGCGHGDHAGHEAHEAHSGQTMELAESTAVTDSGSGCCGGHGH